MLKKKMIHSDSDKDAEFIKKRQKKDLSRSNNIHVSENLQTRRRNFLKIHNYKDQKSKINVNKRSRNDEAKKKRSHFAKKYRKNHNIYKALEKNSEKKGKIKINICKKNESILIYEGDSKIEIKSKPFSKNEDLKSKNQILKKRKDREFQQDPLKKNKMKLKKLKKFKERKSKDRINKMKNKKETMRQQKIRVHKIENKKRRFQKKKQEIIKMENRSNKLDEVDEMTPEERIKSESINYSNSVEKNIKKEPKKDIKKRDKNKIIKYSASETSSQYSKKSRENAGKVRRENRTKSSVEEWSIKTQSNDILKFEAYKQGSEKSSASRQAPFKVNPKIEFKYTKKTKQINYYNDENNKILNTKNLKFESKPIQEDSLITVLKNIQMIENPNDLKFLKHKIYSLYKEKVQKKYSSSSSRSSVLSSDSNMRKRFNKIE